MGVAQYGAVLSEKKRMGKSAILQVWHLIYLMHLVWNHGKVRCGIGKIITQDVESVNVRCP